SRSRWHRHRRPAGGLPLSAWPAITSTWSSSATTPWSASAPPARLPNDQNSWTIFKDGLVGRGVPVSERAYSVFAQVDARAEIERSLREAGFREIPEAGRWLNEAGQTPAQWAHGLPGGGRNPRHLVKTWGCQMNEHDSEIMAAQLELMGYEPTDEVEEAELILLNTCAIRHVAEIGRA